MSELSTPAPSPRPLPVQEWLERIDRSTEQAVAVVERSRQFSAAVDGVRGAGEFGGVKVEVDAHGRLVGTGFTARALERGGASVSSAVAMAHAAAIRDALEGVVRVADEAWPDEPETARTVAGEFTARWRVAR